MPNSSLVISNFPIRQDSNGLFCLNDLHKASGGSQKHQPTNWLRNQQTNDLIDYLKSEESTSGIPVINTKQGIGTFSVKELVYSYAMWISAKFHIQVIRAYDSLVNQAPQLPAPRAKTYITGGLEKHQQDEINDMIALLVENVPQDKKAKTKIMIYSAINTKFGTKGMKHGYKNIAAEHFENITQLIARLPLEGELLPLQQKFLVTIEGGVSRSQPVPNDAYVLNTEQIKQNISEITPGHRLIPKNLYTLFMTLQEEIVKQQK